MATNPQARVLELLKRFNNGNKVSIDDLQYDVMWEGKSEKTIRRDLDVIKEYFPESFELVRGGKGEKGSYKALTNKVFDKFMNKNTIALLVQTFNLAQRSNAFESLDISDDDKRILEAEIKKSNNRYVFITKPYETKKGDVELLESIGKAIDEKKQATLIQEENSARKAYDVKPYKIVFINENFYLACEPIESEYPFSMFRLTNIQKFTAHAKSFNINPDIDSFIKEMQTPFSKYTPEFRKHLIEVRVEVHASKAKFFKAKHFLPSQRVLDTKEDGSLLLSFKVTQEIEMEELVKKWIPHMKVITPLSLKEKIETDLKQYLNI